MAWSKSACKAYDIRWVYGVEIDEHLAFLLGKGIGRYLKFEFAGEGKLLYAADTRYQNNTLVDYFLAGMQGVGNHSFYGVTYTPPIPNPDPTKVLDYGVCSTGFAYYFGRDYQLTVIFTASHNAGDCVGFKVVDQDGLAIDPALLWTRLEAETEDDFPVTTPVIEYPHEEYLTAITTHKQALFYKLDQKYSTLSRAHHFVVDYSNGAGVSREQQYLANHLEPKHTIHHLNDFPDGTFPAHHSDTINPANYDQALGLVREKAAEFGIMFDGDADRIGFVSPGGRVAGWDVIGAIITKQVLSEAHPYKEKTILYDLTCSKIVPQTIEKYGAKAIMTRVWRPRIANQLAEENGLFACEMSSHFMFGTLGNHEMPLLALFYVMRELEQYANFDAMLDAFTVGYAEGVKDFHVADRDAVLQKLKEKFADLKQLDLDGVSIYAPTRRCNMRKSHTENKLILSLQADTKEIYETQLALIKSMSEQ